MNIQAINNQIFQAKFRIPVMNLSYPEGEQIVTITRYKVYENPLAKDIFERAQKIKDPYEKEKLMSQMGTYDYEEKKTSMDRLLPEIREALCKKRQK